MGSPTKAENPERSRGQDSRSFAFSGCRHLRATRDLRMECRNSLSIVSMNQFLLYVVASKVSEMKQNRDFFTKRSAGRTRQQSADGLKKILDKVSVTNRIIKGDELPDGT